MLDGQHLLSLSASFTMAQPNALLGEPMSDTSFQRLGFLSGEIAREVEHIRSKHRDWFNAAHRVNVFANRLLRENEPIAWNREQDDPVVISFAIMCRSVRAYQAAVLLTERGLLAEAGMLTRIIIENALWLDFIADYPNEAIDVLREDDERSDVGIARVVLQFFSQHADDYPEILARAKSDLKTAQEKWRRRADRVSVQTISDITHNLEKYAIYREYSGLYIHTSLKSVRDRMVTSDATGRCIGFALWPDSLWVPETVDALCKAMLGAVCGFVLHLNLPNTDEVWDTIADLFAGIPSLPKDEEADTSGA